MASAASASGNVRSITGVDAGRAHPDQHLVVADRVKVFYTIRSAGFASSASISPGAPGRPNR